MILSESVTSFGSPAEWFRVFTGLAPIACGFAVVGAITGAIFRGRRSLQIAMSIIVSVALFVLLVLLYPDPTVWSWQHPIASAAYQLGPFALYGAIPAVLASLYVGRWCLRRDHLTRR